MAVHQHLIRKQTIEVVYEGASDGFAFKEQLALLCKQKLLPAIEKVCDGKATEGKVIKVNELNIDVGELPAENWEELLCEKVVEQLAALLFSASITGVSENARAGVEEVHESDSL